MSKLIFKVRLRQLMDRDGILQRELADVVHVSPVLISKYVSGKTFPRYNKLLNDSYLFPNSIRCFSWSG